jgi:hypoxanthine-guanine phosphoribosyltransferase
MNHQTLNFHDGNVASLSFETEIDNSCQLALDLYLSEAATMRSTVICLISGVQHFTANFNLNTLALDKTAGSIIASRFHDKPQSKTMIVTLTAGYIEITGTKVHFSLA